MRRTERTVNVSFHQHNEVVRYFWENDLDHLDVDIDARRQ
jgi:hypothetical protein